MSLTKEHISASIQKHLSLPKRKSIALIDSFFELMKKTLEYGEDVFISGFGKFFVKEKNERKGRNPRTGEDLNLNSRRVVVFKCSPRLRDLS